MSLRGGNGARVTTNSFRDMSLRGGNGARVTNSFQYFFSLVILVGDLMSDVYLTGSVARV
jgi:hypothetical protein